MRIALVVPGGVSRDGEYRVLPFVLWLVERLARRHDIHVIALRQEPRRGSWQLRGATVHNVGPRPRAPRALGILLRLHRWRPFDVFHAIWANTPGWVAFAAARICRRPVLVHVAGGELVWMPDLAFGVRREWRRSLSKAMLRRADRVTVASTPMAGLVRSAGATPIRVTLGVDTGVWKPTSPRARPVDQAARLVQVASLTPVKDQTTLLAAVARLVARGRSLHLDLVGEDAYERAIHRRAAELGLAPHVTFHGFLPQRLAVGVVRQATLMVVSSRHEAGPVAMLEAAAVGVPTVGTAVGHLRDFAPDAALAVPVGDAEALAGAITALLNDEPRRLAIARRAQELALSHDADWTCAQFEKLYADVVDNADRAWKTDLATPTGCP